MSTTQYLLNNAHTIPLSGTQVHPYRVWVVVQQAGLDLQYPLRKPLWLDAFKGERIVQIKGLARIDITEYVTGLSWTDGADSAFGDLRISLDNPKGLFNTIPLGSRIQVQTRYGNGKNIGTKWKPFLDTYLFEKNRSADGDSKTMEWTTHDKLYWLHTKTVRGNYRANKRHKRGWLASAIIRDLCKKYGVPVGKIDTTAYYIQKIDLKGTFLSQINKVLKKDKSATGRKATYTVNMHDGKLNVVRDRGDKPRVAYVINEADMIEQGSLSESALDTKVYTRVKLTGKIRVYRKNKKKRRVAVIKTITVTANPVNKNYQALYGVRTKKHSLKGIYTKASLQKRAKILLSQHLTPAMEFSVTCRAIPSLRSGDRVYVVAPYFGVHGLVKLTSVQYDLKGNDFSMQLGFDLKNKIPLTAAETAAIKKKLTLTGDERVRY